jgi:EmrB/QacA subfamily drug resistance transporter
MHHREHTHTQRPPDADPRADTVRDSDGQRPWSLLILLCAAQFMVILDATIVNVALPSIRGALHFAPTDLQWVVTAYVLATGGLLLLGGRAADLLGRRPAFLAGLATFTTASLASGLAPSSGALIAARAAQGVGAALLSPAALSILTTSYTGTQRARALSTWGAIGGAGAAAGVLLGGMLTSWLDWRWVFFVNVPTGALTALIALKLIPSGRSMPGTRAVRGLDLPGAAGLVAGLVTLVYAVQGAATHGWASMRTLGLLVVAAGLLMLFASIERRARRPLVTPSVWRLRSLISGTTVMLGVTGILVGTSFLNTLFFQNVLGASPLVTGLEFLPGVLTVGVAAHLGPQLLTRFGARPVIATGLLLMAAGDLILSGAPAHASYLVDLLPAFLLLGLGVGLAFVAISVTSMSDVDHDHAGLASGLITTAHELGGAAGVSLFSAVAFGAGGATGAGFISGYSHGTLAAAAIAAGLALVAVVTVPQLRPTGGQRVALH